MRVRELVFGGLLLALGIVLWQSSPALAEGCQGKWCTPPVSGCVGNGNNQPNCPEQPCHDWICWSGNCRACLNNFVPPVPCDEYYFKCTGGGPPCTVDYKTAECFDSCVLISNLTSEPRCDGVESVKCTCP